jgi:hypothetical protein
LVDYNIICNFGGCCDNIFWKMIVNENNCKECVYWNSDYLNEEIKKNMVNNNICCKRDAGACDYEKEKN